jgi:hypothetical protein
LWHAFVQAWKMHTSKHTHWQPFVGVDFASLYLDQNISWASCGSLSHKDESIILINWPLKF